MEFLDMRIVESTSGFKFKVHRKPTNKEDCVHFCSAHSQRFAGPVAQSVERRAPCGESTRPG